MTRSRFVLGLPRLRTVVGFIGTLSAIVIALALLDWNALLRAFAQFTAGTLLAAAAWSLATTLILSARWAVMIASETSVSRRGFLDALVAQVFNLITPAAVGADAYRVLISGDRTGGRSRAVGLVLVERILGVSAYAAAFLVAYAYVYKGAPAVGVFGAAAATFSLMLAGCIAAVVLSRSIAGKFIRRLGLRGMPWLAEAVEAAGALPLSRLAAASALSLASTFTWLACVIVLTDAAGLALGAGFVTMIAVVTEFSRLLPISIQGIGVREATFAALANAAGGAAAAAFVAAATAYVLHFSLVALAGLAARTAQQAYLKYLR